VNCRSTAIALQGRDNARTFREGKEFLQLGQLWGF
jgi:hypothetical protein